MSRKIVISIAIVIIAVICAAAAVLLHTPSTSRPTGAKTNVTTTTTATTKSTVILNIGGATFPAIQFLSEWIPKFRQKYHIEVEYSQVGSGAGIAGFLSGLYDIALHDPPMPSYDWEKAVQEYGPILECPDVVGSVAIIYNIPGLRGTLNLTGPLLADIFLGKITNWCNRKILKYNPGLVPICEKNNFNIPIRVVVRAEASGTTYIFTTYLSLVSKDFNETIGPSFLPDWESAWMKYAHTIIGEKAKRNAGVALTVMQTKWSIGYVEWSYAVNKHLPVAALQNPLGQFVKPTAETIMNALEGAIKMGVLKKFNPLADLAKLGVVKYFLNVPAKDAYPIVSFSFLTVRLHYPRSELSKALAIYYFLKFIWIEDPHYVKGYLPVPKEIRELCFNALRQHMMVGNEPITKFAKN